MIMAQEKRIVFSNILIVIGLLIMVIMALLPLLDNSGINMELMRWGFTMGAIMVLIGRLVGIYRGSSFRIKRLHSILIFSALLYCASASMMFIFQGTNNWIAFLLAGLVVQMYASWMIDRENSKTEN
jgi:peptidoglycan/LPS O-acetylase OafA/YrhL